MVAEFLHHQPFPCQPLAYKARLGGVGISAVAESGCLAGRKCARRHLMGSPVIPSLSVRDLGSAPFSWCPGASAYFSGLRLLGFWGCFSGCVSCALLGAPGSLRGNLLVLQKGEVGGPRALLFGEPIASFADVSPVSSQSTSQSTFGCPRCVEMLYLFGVRQRVASTECFAGLQRK